MDLALNNPQRLIYHIIQLNKQMIFSAEGQDSPNECPSYDTKQSDGEVPVMLEL